MEIKEIKQLAAILKKEGLEELEWQEGEFYLRLKRETAAVFSGPDQYQVVTQPQVVSPVAVTESKSAETPSDGPAAGNRIITSPIVGTFYSAPSPKADPYAREGERVSSGQVLCIIEAMKLMNELEAEYPCEIVKILVENAQPVEYGEALFEVKPT